jgi:hypothetical protein
MNPDDIAKKLTDSLNERKKAKGTLEERLKTCEPLGDLKLSIKDVLDLMSTLQGNLERRDFGLALLIVSLMYGIETEEEFMTRLAKAVLTTSPDDEIKVESEP